YFEISGIYTFATASLRNINNTQQVLKQIKKTTGIDIDIITGEEEARLDFIGATHMLNVTDGLLVDIGGGSTELVDFKAGKILSAVSIPLGSLNTYKQYCTKLIPTVEEQAAISDAVIKELKKLKQINKEKHSLFCGVGGTVRATKKINNEVFGIMPSNNKILCSDLTEITKELTENPITGLDLILRIAPDRLRTIVSGVTILRTIADYFSGDEILVSSYGVREGYLYGKILGESYGNI
ncbi:MAG: phosphatase, partial [Oscillospiraceae bacterium]